MREIEFRAIFDGEWVFGSLDTSGKSKYIFEKGTEIAYQIEDDNTIGQYTGLKDKNGVKIFEGDIILWPSDTNVYAVVYITEVASFVGRCKTKNDFEYLDNGIGENQSLKVIGNIHDNPEILEAAK